MTLYELLQIKEDYIETSDVDYDVLVGTDLVKDEDINENTDNYFKFLNYIAHNVEVTDARNDICNWSKFVLDHKVALTKYAEENWYEVPEDESDFIYEWINELHSYQSGNISEKMYKDFIDAMNTYQKDERTYKPYYDYLKQYISDNLDNGLITLYHSYDDNIDKDIIQKYINAVVLGYPTDSFYDVIYEYVASCIDADYYEDALIKELLDNAPTEEIREQIKNADYADIIDDLNECGYIGVDYNIDDLLRNTSVKVNVLLGTDSEYAKQRAGQNLETEGVIGYTIDGVCGMVGDFWKSNSVSYTDTAPTLVNENIETTLNEIEQANEEKNEEIER